MSARMEKRIDGNRHKKTPVSRAWGTGVGQATRALFACNFDLLGLGCGGFGESEGEHAQFVIGATFGGIQSSHDSELAAEKPWFEAFDFGFGLDGENVLVELDVDFLGIDARHVDGDDDVVFCFFDIDGGDDGFFLFRFLNGV